MAFVSEQQSVAGIYSDLNGLESIKSLSRKDRDGALRELSQQFEALLVNMMLSSMRSANEAFSSDSPFNSSEAQMYQDMLDQQLTVTLSQKGGMGLAEVIFRQLSPGGSVAPGGADPLQGSRLESQARNIRSVSGGSPDRQAVAQWRIDDPQQFVTELQPLAQRTAAELGMPAELLLSQAALETGWGAHLLHSADGRPSFNFFNIKAGRDWQGDVVNVPTLEYRDGVAVREWAAFRAYDSAAEGFADYAALVSGSPRYRTAMANSADAETYIRELAAAGYATDPDYADKVLSVMRHAAMAVARNGGEG